MNILAIYSFSKSVKKFNTYCKETLHFSPVTSTSSVTDSTGNLISIMGLYSKEAFAVPKPNSKAVGTPNGLLLYHFVFY